MATVLVTGSSGFIGGRLAARLREDNKHEVIGLDPRPGPQTNLVGWPSEHQAYRKCEVVFHLGALTGVEECEQDREGAWRANVAETIRLVHVARPKVFVYASSVAATTSALTLYGRTKKLAELVAERAFDNRVIVVLPNVYGYGGRGVVSRFFQEPDAFIRGSGEQLREFVYVDDVVERLIGEAETAMGNAVAGKAELRYVSPEGERVNINTLALMMNRTPRHVPARPFDVDVPVLMGTGNAVTPLALGLRKMRDELRAAGVRYFAQVGSVG